MHSRCRSAASGAAPQASQESEDRSYSATAGWRASASTTGGTTTVWVIRCSWIAPRNACGSNRGRVTTVAPTWNAQLATTPQPTACERGATASVRSSGPILSAATVCSTLATHARWVSITPLGRPVVPLE